MRANVTLRDVANAASVSVSTASRVLDERLPPSRSAAAERVRRAASDLGYARDVTASALRRGGTSTIGVLVPRLSDTVMALLFEAISAEAAARGLFAMVSACGDDPGQVRRAAEQLLARRVDGLVLATAKIDDEVARFLRDRGTPHVLALRSDRESPTVTGGDDRGGYDATRHLLDLGHRQIGVLAGPQYTSTAQDRLSGYRLAMQHAGVEVHPRWVRESGYRAQDGDVVGAALLSDHPELTAVFAVNDDLALGAMAAARRAGIEVPGDLSVVGYNDIPVAAQLPVGLTSMHVPLDEIAALTLDLLARSPSADAGTVLRSATPTLVHRASTAPPRQAR